MPEAITDGPGLAVLVSFWTAERQRTEVKLYVGGKAIRLCRSFRFRCGANGDQVATITMELYGTKWIDDNMEEMSLPGWMPGAWPPDPDMADLVLFTKGTAMTTTISLYGKHISLVESVDLSATVLSEHPEDTEAKRGDDHVVVRVVMATREAYDNMASLVEGHHLAGPLDIFPPGTRLAQ